MHKQRGMTFIGLVLIIAGIVFIAAIGIKLAPAYIEYMSVRNVITKIGNEPSFAEMSPKEIKDDFDKGATISYITVITSNDLTIEKGEGGKPIVTAEYQVVVPIVANVSALLDFRSSTEKSSLGPKKLNVPE